MGKSNESISLLFIFVFFSFFRTYWYPNDRCGDMCLFMLGIILMLNVVCCVISGTRISISYMPNNDRDV